MILTGTFECYMIAYRIYTVPAPHTFLNSFGRAAKSNIWTIRHWGGDANSNPYVVLRTVVTKRFILILWSMTFISWCGAYIHIRNLKYQTHVLLHNCCTHRTGHIYHIDHIVPILVGMGCCAGSVSYEDPIRAVMIRFAGSVPCRSNPKTCASRSCR